MMGTGLSNRFRVSFFVLFSLALTLPASPTSPGGARSAPPDERAEELLKVEEEALQYLQKKRDFYAMLLDDSYVLYCLPVDPDALSEHRLPSGTHLFWTQKFGLAVWKSKEEMRRALAFLHRYRFQGKKAPLEDCVASVLEFSRAFKEDLKQTVISELEERIKNKKLAVEKLRAQVKRNEAPSGGTAAEYFLEKDFNVFSLDAWPEVEKKRFRTDRPTPSLMYSGIWLLGGKVNIIIAIEAYESDIVAQVMFEDRAKALEAGTGKERKARSERKGPTGHFKLDEASEICDSWLPEQDSDWIGSRARLRRFKNALITVTASYLDPIEEERLAKLMKSLEYRATTVVDAAIIRNRSGKAGEGSSPQPSGEGRP